MIERVKSAMVGLGATWVLLLMVVLSVVSLAIMLERAWLYWSLRDNPGDLMRDLGKLLRSGDLEGARRRLEQSPSAEAAVVIAGIVEANMGYEAAEEAMAGASALQHDRQRYDAQDEHQDEDPSGPQSDHRALNSLDHSVFL